MDETEIRIKLEPGYVIRESERDESGMLVIKSIDLLELSIVPTVQAQTVEGLVSRR